MTQPRRGNGLPAGALLLLLAMGACAPSDIADAAGRPSPGAGLPAETALDWPTYGGQPSGSQYSSLAQINTGNVRRLELAWSHRTSEVSEWSPEVHGTNYQVTPILANHKLYLCTPFNNVLALDPASGEELWKFDFGKPRAETMYGYHNCRGVAYWQAAAPTEAAGFCGKRVFEATDNGFLLALDGDSGQLCPDFGQRGRIDLNALDYRGDGRISLTSPPVIYQDLAIVGGAVIDNKWRDSLDGIVRAFDVRSGAEVWRWNPIPEHLSAEVGGANAWAPLSVDEERGWVFLPIGSPSYDTYGVNRADPIPFGNAVVALDALTGKPIWSYQTVHHDLWDYDLPSMPSLVTLRRQARPVPAVLQAAKTGFVFVLDRETGTPLFPVREKPVPQTDVPGERSAPTQPFPLAPPPMASQSIKAEDAWGLALFDRRECREKLAGLRNEGLFTPPSINGAVLHPSFLGGSNWGGVAYDQSTGLAVVNSSNLVSSVTLKPRPQFDAQDPALAGASVYEMRGAPYVMLRQVLLSSLGVPCNPPPWGQLTALDLNSGELRWQVPFGRMELAGGWLRSPAAWGAPNQGGPIITGGGLVFIGASLDSRLRAYDLLSGKELWSAKTPAPATATPMTYQFGPQGRQYVVVAAGGNGAFETKLSDAILAYALPE